MSSSTSTVGLLTVFFIWDLSFIFANFSAVCSTDSCRMQLISSLILIHTISCTLKTLGLNCDWIDLVIPSWMLKVCLLGITSNRINTTNFDECSWDETYICNQTPIFSTRQLQTLIWGWMLILRYLYLLFVNQNKREKFQGQCSRNKVTYVCDPILILIRETNVYGCIWSDSDMYLHKIRTWIWVFLVEAYLYSYVRPERRYEYG